MSDKRYKLFVTKDNMIVLNRAFGEYLDMFDAYRAMMSFNSSEYAKSSGQKLVMYGCIGSESYRIGE